MTSEASQLALAEALAQPSAHPHDASAAGGVSWIQTHISHVFLTRARVSKLRKPVGLAFLDFRAREARNLDCLNELALNRRLAPDVYLGLAPVEFANGAARIGALREDLAAGCEHVVVMRRLREGCDALSLLERGALRAEHVDLVALRVAAFHGAHELGRPAPFTAEDWRERIAKPVRDTLTPLADAAREGALAASDVAALAIVSEQALARAAPAFEARRQRGGAVDAHGDLHLQHIWFEGGAADPILIDCIEFSERLRRIDAAAEVAFLAMDLRYRGAAALAERFLRRYAAARDDFDLYRVVDFYAAYRAAVRAMVAALAAGEAELPPAQRARAAESARRHVALALELLAPWRPFAEPQRAPLVVVCGSVGSGKSTAAEALADACEGVVISSDRTRKALAGVAETARGADLYAPARIAAVYAALLERATPVLASGRVAILDATYARREERAHVLAFAAEARAPAWLLEVTCRAEVARARVVARAARGDDPSDAGAPRVDVSRREFEAPDEWPAERRLVVETDAEGWQAALGRVAERLRG